MAHQFSDLRARMTPDARETAGSRAQTMLAQMPLTKVLRARVLSQSLLTELLHVQPPSIAKIENHADMYLSSLRSQIEAMGGELEVVARFPDGDIKISNFSDLGNTAAL